MFAFQDFTVGNNQNAIVKFKTESELNVKVNAKPRTAQLRDEVIVKAVTTDLNLVAEAINDMEASGGGTCPEASIEALDIDE